MGDMPFIGLRAALKFGMVQTREAVFVEAKIANSL